MENLNKIFNYSPPKQIIYHELMTRRISWINFSNTLTTIYTLFIRHQPYREDFVTLLIKITCVCFAPYFGSKKKTWKQISKYTLSCRNGIRKNDYFHRSYLICKTWWYKNRNLFRISVRFFIFFFLLLDTIFPA